MAGIFPSNEDVVVEILLRLPAKSLIRFKLVCKQWLSLISAQQFCRLHTLRHPKPRPSLILRTHTSHYFYFDPIPNNHRLIPYNFAIPNSKILNSCNGLLLLLLQSVRPVEHHVYNPTKQSRKIDLVESEDFTKVMGLTLAFDPSKSHHYKIVCVRAKPKPPSSGQRHCRIEVYDSRTLTWRMCLEPLTAPIGANFSSGVHSCSSSMAWGRRRCSFSLPTPRIGRPSLPFHHRLAPRRQINSSLRIVGGLFSVALEVSR